MENETVAQRARQEFVYHRAKGVLHPTKLVVAVNNDCRDRQMRLIL